MTTGICGAKTPLGPCQHLTRHGTCWQHRGVTYDDAVTNTVAPTSGPAPAPSDLGLPSPTAGKAKGGPKLSPAEKAEQLSERLNEGILELVESDRWSDYLDVQTRFHNYSFSNTMMILINKPDATRVAGFRKWQELGRQVRKGETGIPIFAPMFRREKGADEPAPGADPDGKGPQRLVGFRIVHVFDEAQTDGEHIPTAGDFAVPVDQEHVDSEAVGKLSALASHHGATVDLDGDPATDPHLASGANGYTSFNPNGGPPRIVVSKHLSPAQQVKTTAHELAHQLMHDPHDVGPDHSQPQHRGEKEIEAESVAYIVSNHLGVKADSYSFGYVAHWAKGDVALVKSTMGRVQKYAAQIIGELDKTNQKEEVAA